MRTIRIFQPGNYAPGDTIELSPSAAQHVGTVLRMRLEESLTLFSGDNKEYTATIIEIQKKRVCVTIKEAKIVDRESPLKIHLAQAVSKGERMEFVIQKAVELGVASITPILTERCVVRIEQERLAKKHAQWQAIAVAACEQCGRNTLPMIQSVVSLQDFLFNCQSSLKFILNPEAKLSWRHYTIASADLTLLIGPEGGLSEAEIVLAEARQFQSLRLGPRVLRTETAAISSISLLQAIAGDL